MDSFTNKRTSVADSFSEIHINDDVIAYIQKKKTDFRISTSCGGPVLLPVSYKPPKKTDIRLRAGDYIIYVSIHQVSYMSEIHMGMVPFHQERTVGV